MDEQFQELKGLILGMREHVDQRFNQIDQRFNQIDQQMADLRDYVDERTRNMETTLLTEFHKWEIPVEAALKPLPRRVSTIERRISSIEERLSGLEDSNNPL